MNDDLISAFLADALQEAALRDPCSVQREYERLVLAKSVHHYANLKYPCVVFYLTEAGWKAYEEWKHSG